MPLLPLYCNGTNVVANCKECHGHSYGKSCESSVCLWSPSTLHFLSVFLLFTSKVTPLLLFQPISRCSSHALLSYWNSYLIVSAFGSKLPVWRLQPLLFLLINQKSCLLLYITGVVNMSGGEDNEMKENGKTLKWVLCPEPFKHKPTFMALTRAKQNTFREELLYKQKLICNYVIYLCWPDASVSFVAENKSYSF